MVDPDRFERLCREHDELREDFKLLLRCLGQHETTLKTRSCSDARGISLIPALMRRAKLFKTLERFHPGEEGQSRSLEDALQPEAVHAVLAQFGGGNKELFALMEASSACKACVEAAKAEVYVFGGADAHYGNALNNVERFDPRAGKWDSLPPMRVRRAGGVAAVLGRRIYICGGAGEVCRMIEEFDTKSQSWDRTPPSRTLSATRHAPAAATVGGRLYVCGGEDGAAQAVHSTVECLDPRLPKGRGGCEELPARMRAARLHFAAAPLPGQGPKLMVHGGVSTPMSKHGTPDEGPVLGTAEVLALAERGGAWKLVPGPPYPRMAHSMAALSGRVYLCGGHSGDVVPLSTVACFDPTASAWVECAPMAAARGDCGMVATAGSLYVFGGVSSVVRGAPALRSGERFSPSAGTWEPLPDMAQRRQDFAAAVAVRVGVGAA